MESERRPSKTGGTVLFALLYFSEGAPIGFIWWALPTMLRARGIEVGSITTLTAALVLPWTLKFLWAPVVDALRGPRWTRRHWIGASQVAMGLCLVPLVFLDPVRHLPWWTALLLAHAYCAATQDVAVDALAIQLVSAANRGRLNGAMQAGMLAGRSLFGGVSLIVADRWGPQVVFVALIVSIWCTLAVLWCWPGLDEATPPGGERNVIAAVGRALGRMLRRRTTWYGALFALAGGAAFEAAGALRGPYLIDHGATEEAVGWFFSLPSTSVMLAGGLVGGWIADRSAREPVVATFLGLIVASVLLLAVLPDDAPLNVRYTGFSILYLGIGLFTASSYALFMDLVDPEAGATEFTAFMAATNLCEAWAGYVGGQLVERAGYGVMFAVMAAVSFAAAFVLVPLARARRRQGSGNS